VVRPQVRNRRLCTQLFANIFPTSRTLLLLLLRRADDDHIIIIICRVRKIMRDRPPARPLLRQYPHCNAHPPNRRFTETAVIVSKTRGMFSILVLCLSTAAFLFGRCGCDGQTTDVGSLTSQIGGYTVFKCPAVPQPRFDHDGGLRRLVAVRWTKDVSARL